MNTMRQSCNHPKGEGCMWCCAKCDTDTHLCPGCGANLDHGEHACPVCSKEAELSRQQDTTGQPAPQHREVRYY